MVGEIYISKKDEAEKFVNWGGEIRYLVMPPRVPVRNVTLEIGTFKPGEDLKEHMHHSSEEIYYVLEGKGLLRIDGEEYEIKEEMAVLIPPGKKHYLKNTGDRDLKIVFVTSPPEQWWLLDRLEALENKLKSLGK